MAREVGERRVGEIDEGTVSDLLPFGAVVRLDGGGRGLLPEVEWQERPEVGQRLRVEILAVDRELDRMSLRPA